MLQKRYHRRLVPLVFIALMLENELQYITIQYYFNKEAVRTQLRHRWKLQYHGPAEGNISTNNASVSCENFVKFGPVTSELAVLICERQVRHGQITGVFRRIFPDILDRFLQSSHHMKVLYIQMMDLYFIFQFLKGRCHGNQIILP